MNQQASEFQIRYPLSRKKFWKKIFPDIFTFFMLSIFIGFMAGALTSVAIYSSSPTWGQITTYGITWILIVYVSIISIKAWYIKAYISRYYYDCTDQFITIRKGVFTPTEIHVQYAKIQDVYVDQDLLDRLFNIYDVHIASATATSGIEAHIDGVDPDIADAIKNILLSKIISGGAEQNPSPDQSPQVLPPVPVGQDISSKTYPIESSWMTMKFLSYIVSSGVIDLFLFIFVGSYMFKDLNYPALGPSWIYFWFLLIYFVLLFGQSVATWVWKNNFFFEFKPEYIQLNTQVITRNEVHVPYRTIQNVLKKQGLLERVFGLYSVTIQNATQSARTSISASITVPGQSSDAAERLVTELNTIVSSQRNYAGTGL